MSQWDSNKIDDIQLFVSYPQAAQGLKVDFQWSLAQTHWSTQAFLCFAQPLGRSWPDVVWRFGAMSYHPPAKQAIELEFSRIEFGLHIISTRGV